MQLVLFWPQDNQPTGRTIHVLPTNIFGMEADFGPNLNVSSIFFDDLHWCFINFQVLLGPLLATLCKNIQSSTNAMQTFTQGPVGPPAGLWILKYTQHILMVKRKCEDKYANCPAGKYKAIDMVAMISTMKGAFATLTCCLSGRPSEVGSLPLRWFALYQSYYGPHPLPPISCMSLVWQNPISQKYSSANRIDCSGYGFHENH